jgi:hypothetical protein
LLTWERETGRDPRFPPNTLAVLRDPVTLARVREFDADGPQDEMIAISPDGLWLAIGRYGGRWSLWDVPTGKRLATFEGHRDYLTSIHFAGPGRVVTGSGDLTALVWDLDPNQRPKGGLWESLSGKDADEAFRATWALAADPKGPERLRSKIAPVPAPPVDKVRQWLTDLGADKFPVREAATKVLLELGRVAEPDLRAARAKAATEEERTRLDAILAKIPRERTATEVIQARAAQAMELARTEAARKVLAEWAAGAPGARLTIDAKAALARLR